MSGDIMQFDLQQRLLQQVGPDRGKFPKGVSVIQVRFVQQTSIGTPGVLTPLKFADNEEWGVGCWIWCWRRRFAQTCGLANGAQDGLRRQSDLNFIAWRRSRIVSDERLCGTDSPAKSID